MTIQASLPLIVAVVGGVVFFVREPRFSKLGLVAFAIGLFVFLFLRMRPGF